MQHRFGDKSKRALGTDQEMCENIERGLVIEKGVEQIAVVILHLVTAADLFGQSFSFVLGS